MTSALWYAIAAALGNVAGGLCAVRGIKLGLKLIEGLVAFGAGFMLSVAIVEVLPQALARGRTSKIGRAHV